MKFVKIFAGIVTALLAILYIVLFTGVGNAILRPVIENRVSEAVGIPVKLQKFHLSMSDLDVILYLSDDNSVRVYGDYSPFSQSFDLKYEVKLLSLADLRALTKQQLAGRVETEGTLRGDPDLMTVDGVSDVAKSDTSYHIELTKFEVTSVKADVRSLQVDALLAILTQPSFVHAALDMDLNFKNIKPHQLDGIVHLQTHKGRFDEKVIQNQLGITIPHTQFAMKADAKLQKESIDYDYLFDSNLLKLTTKGVVTPQPLAMDIAYKASIKELALLKPVTHANLRGRVNAEGTLKGNKKKMAARLYSDIASSKTAVALTLKEFRPATLEATIAHLRLEKLFYMLQQPHYAAGDFSLKADVDNFTTGSLSGKVTATASGRLDAGYLTKAYRFKHPMPQTSFRLRSVSELKGAYVDTFATLVSSLADVSVKKARFNVETGSLESDYKLKVPSLEKLYFVTDRHLRGGIEAAGKIQKVKNVTLTAHSKIAGGAMQMKLADNDLHLDLNDVRTKKVLWILKYPEIFDGGMFAKVDYNLKSQKGSAKADFKNGKFVKNHVFDLLRKFGKVDLYKEYFNGNAKADINKEKIAAAFDLKSRKAEIRSDKTLLDTKRSRIDSKIELRVEKTPVKITLKGDIAKPMVGVDLKAFMQSQAGKKLEKKAGKEINKLLNKLF